MKPPHPIPSSSAGMGLDFWIESRTLWSLDIPTGELPMSDLVWNLMFNRWGYDPLTDTFDLAPFDLLLHPNQHPQHWQRMEQASLSYPIEVMYRHNRWIVMDGLHRLVKTFALGHQTVKVRKFYPKHIVLIDPNWPYDSSVR